MNPSRWCCIAAIALSLACAATAASNFPPIWPYPQTFTNGSDSVAVSYDVQFRAVTESPDLHVAFQRYRSIMFPRRVDNRQRAPGSVGTIIEILVDVADVTVPLTLATDESYTLVVPADGTVIISAATVYGAFYGLETLSQLVAFDADALGYNIANVPWTVKDAPRFKHREVLIDTARHYQSLSSLRALIASLPYAKINVMHWHLVDSQSFPLVTPSAPALSQQGAFSPAERYTPNDVQDIVEFARLHGVRVVPEIDTPGHAASWCAGHPEICPSSSCLEPLNPAVPATFDVINNVLTDVAASFPEQMMHLGGDEVDTTCWTVTPSIVAWLAANNYTTDQAYMYAVKRVQYLAHTLGKDVVGWEEIWNHFGTQLAPSTIIHQWLPGSQVAVNATSHGYRVLWSTDGVWYLDGLGVTWQTMYVQEPCAGIADDVCAALVLGGGGEMWGETVDGSDLQQTVWPRLGAIGERLWSPRAVASPDDAAVRYSALRCRLNQRGVAAAPALNGQARQPPPGPGACMDQ